MGTSGRILRKTLADMRGQLLFWGIGVAVLAAAMVLVFPSIQKMEGLVGFLDQLPATMKALIGDISAMVVLEGFLRVKLFEPLPLVLSIFAIIQGASAIAGEEERHTLDLLLAQPVRRSVVVVAKYFSIVVGLVIICGFLCVGMVGAFALIDAEVNYGRMLLSVFNVLPLCLGSAALAMLGSCVFHKQRHAATLAGVFVGASYFLNAIGLLVPGMGTWRWGSVFFHHAETLPMRGDLQAEHVWGLLVFALLLVGASLVAFERKELRV